MIVIKRAMGDRIKPVVGHHSVCESRKLIEKIDKGNSD